MEEAVPVLRVTQAARALEWYSRLGYTQEWEYRVEPGFPAFVSVARNGGSRIFLSEHTGDAKPDGLVCLRLDDIQPIATEFGTNICEQPWGREVELVDPDRNRLRVGPTAQNP